MWSASGRTQCTNRRSGTTLLSWSSSVADHHGGEIGGHLSHVLSARKVVSWQARLSNLAKAIKLKLWESENNNIHDTNVAPQH